MTASASPRWQRVAFTRDICIREGRGSRLDLSHLCDRGSTVRVYSRRPRVRGVSRVERYDDETRACELRCHPGSCAVTCACRVRSPSRSSACRVGTGQGGRIVASDHRWVYTQCSLYGCSDYSPHRSRSLGSLRLSRYLFRFSRLSSLDSRAQATSHYRRSTPL